MPCAAWWIWLSAPPPGSPGLLVGKTGTGRTGGPAIRGTPRARGPFVAQLRALPGAARDRAVRPREGLLHRPTGAASGASSWRTRHPLPGRDRRLPGRRSALPPGARVNRVEAEAIHVDVRLIAPPTGTCRPRCAPAASRGLFFRIRGARAPAALSSAGRRPLALLFLDQFARELGRSPRSVTGRAGAAAHRWPGNPRARA